MARSTFSTIFSVLQMRRAISGQEEQELREYFNRTADEIGVRRPLDAQGWYTVKDHLRAKYKDGYPDTMSKEERWTHGIACSNLVIDPEEVLTGAAGLAQQFILWILSPADCHGPVSEAFRCLFLCAVALLLGLALAAGYHLVMGGTTSLTDALAPSLLCMMAMGGFISSDTAFKAVILLLMLCVAIKWGVRLTGG